MNFNVILLLVGMMTITIIVLVSVIFLMKRQEKIKSEIKNKMDKNDVNDKREHELSETFSILNGKKDSIESEYYEVLPRNKTVSLGNDSINNSFQNLNDEAFKKTYMIFREDTIHEFHDDKFISNRKYISITYHDPEITKYKKNVDVITIGRGDECDIVINNDKFVGRIHCIIYYKNNSYYIGDLNSKNGTFIGDKRLQGAEEILDNTKLKIGSTVFIIEFN